MDGQLSIGCRSDALRDLRDRRLALLNTLINLLAFRRFSQPPTFVLRIVKTEVCHQMYATCIHKISFEIGSN